MNCCECTLSITMSKNNDEWKRKACSVLSLSTGGHFCCWFQLIHKTFGYYWISVVLCHQLMNMFIILFCLLSLKRNWMLLDRESSIKRLISALIICIFRSSLQHLKHAGDPFSRRNASHFPLELPKLNVVVPTPSIPYPVSSFPALTGSHRGSLPAISKKCHSLWPKTM